MAVMVLISKDTVSGKKQLLIYFAFFLTDVAFSYSQQNFKDVYLQLKQLDQQQEYNLTDSSFSSNQTKTLFHSSLSSYKVK
jgi:hypothetical protein